MARIIQSETSAFLPAKEQERQTKLQRMSPQDIGTLIRLADAAVSSPAIGAVANIAKAGLSKLGETFSEMGTVLDAKKEMERREEEARSLEMESEKKREESDALFRKPLKETKEPVLSGDEESFRANLKKDYQKALTMESPRESFSALRTRLKEGVQKGWINEDFANKVSKKVEKNLEPKLKSLEDEAKSLESEEKRLSSIDFEQERKDAIAKSYINQIAEQKSDANRLNQMANNLLVQAEEEKDPIKKKELSERYQDALDSASESIARAQMLEEEFKAGRYSPEYIKRVDQWLLQKHKVKDGSKKAPGPTEPSVPQPSEEDLFEGEMSPIQKAAKKIVEEGRSKAVLSQLKEKGYQKGSREDQLFSAVVALELEKRKKAVPPSEPIEKEETGTGEFESRITKKGEKVGKLEPELKKKAQTILSKPSTGFKGKKESLFPKKGSVQGREVVVEEDIGDLSDPEVLKKLREVPEEKAKELAVEKKLSEKGLLEEAEKERKEEAVLLGRESQKKLDESIALKKRAEELRKAPLPSGVSQNADGSWNLPEGKKKYSPEKLLVLAAQANTEEKKKQVLDLIEEVDVPASTLGEMISGSARRRFSEQVVRLFPKIRTTEMSDYQKALLFERKQRLELQLNALREKELRAKTKEERDALSAERKKIKDDLDIISKKQEAGVESPEERQKRKEVSGGAVSLAESQIERNLRTPPSLSIDLRKEGREEKKESRRDLDDQINVEQEKQREARRAIDEYDALALGPRPKEHPGPDPEDIKIDKETVSPGARAAAQKRIEQARRDQEKVEKKIEEWDIAKRKVDAARAKEQVAKKNEEKLRALKALEEAKKKEQKMENQKRKSSESSKKEEAPPSLPSGSKKNPFGE